MLKIFSRQFNYFQTVGFHFNTLYKFFGTKSKRKIAYLVTPSLHVEVLVVYLEHKLHSLSTICSYNETFPIWDKKNEQIFKYLKTFQN